MLLIRKITIYQNFVYYVKAGQIPVSDIELLDRLTVIAGQEGIKKPIELYINPLISSPLLIGFFRPYIVLPSTAIPEQDFRYTLLHELTHYRRGDMFYKWIVQITICLHWFNPLVHLMSQEINKACEFSCDEAVIAKIHSSHIQEYGKTLLNAMVKSGHYKQSLASITLNENKQILKERLGAIMSFKRKSNIIKIFTLLITVTICLGTLFIGAYAADTHSAETPYSIYSNYGISYDKNTDSLFYNNVKIRYFEDNSIVYNGNNSIDGEFIFHTDQTGNGEIDIYTIRNSNNELTNIRVGTEDEFKEKTYQAQSLKNSISVYQELGIRADAIGNIYLDELLVRELFDPVTGTFITNSVGVRFPKDSIDIIAVYDNGQLSGFKKSTQEEYDKNTQKRIKNAQNVWIEQSNK